MSTTVTALWLIALIPLLPALGALINGIFGSRLPKRAVHWIACSAIGLPFLITILCIKPMLSSRNHEIVAHLYKWFESGNLRVDIDFLMDPLSLVMCLVVTGVGFVIHVYSIGYMHEDKSYWRYFAYLNLFCFAMLVLVLGDNLVLLFVGWEGVGLASYLLIGFWYSDDAKAAAGKKAFIVNRIGDFAFLLGVFMLFSFTDTLSISVIRDDLLSWDAARLAQFAPFAAVIALLMFIGCTGKSAQIPLYVWLPDAMAGPTPVSALIHAATMVTAGVYLVVRMNFLYTLAPAILMLIAVIGALTALMAATIGMFQNDIKRVLAYSTISQLGFMFLAAGVGAYTAAIFHLVTHAFFKALLFLGAGAVIHAVHDQDITKMGGLRKKLPIVHGTFLVACLAISGVPLLAGFFSKDEILWGALAGQVGPGVIHGMLWFTATATAGLTAFYMFRLYFLTFWGSYRGTTKHIHKPGPSMTVPLITLAFLSIYGGYLGVPHAFYALALVLAIAVSAAGLVSGVRINRSKGKIHFLSWALGIGGIPIVLFCAAQLLSGHPTNLMHHWLEGVIVDYHGTALAAHDFAGHFEPTLGALWEYGGMIVSVAVAFTGIYFAHKLYVKEPEIPARLKADYESVHQVVFNKYYVDEAYEKVFVNPMKRTADWLHRWVDKLIIDTGMVEGFATVGRMGGLIIRELQNGNVQRYAFFVLFGLSITLYLVFAG